MAKAKKLLSLLVVLAMAVTMLSGMAVVSADGETLTLKAPKRTVGIGEKIQIPVVLSSADGLTGFDIDVKWDPAKLKMSSVESLAVTLPDAVSATGPVINTELVSNGEVIISAASVRGIALTGKAVIATLNFTILAVGDISLSFDTEGTSLSMDASDTPVTAQGCTFTSEDNLLVGWGSPFVSNGAGGYDSIVGSKGTDENPGTWKSGGYTLPTPSTADDVTSYPGMYEGALKFNGKSNIVKNFRCMFANGIPLSMDGYHMIRTSFDIYIPGAEKSNKYTVLFSFANERTSNAAAPTIVFQNGKATINTKGLTKVSSNGNIVVPSDKWVHCYMTVLFEKDSSKPTYTLVIDGTTAAVYTDMYDRTFDTYAFSQLKTDATKGIYFMDNMEVRTVKIAEEPEDIDFAIKDYSFIMEERTDEEAVAYAEKVAKMAAADRCSSKRTCPGGDEGKLYTVDVEVKYVNGTSVAKTGTIIISCALNSKSMVPFAVYAQDVTFEPTGGFTGTVRTTLKLKGLDHDIKRTQVSGHYFTQLKAYVVADGNTLQPLADASSDSYSSNVAGVLWSTATKK